MLALSQEHLLPCPFKYLTGIDCPGCGFQRAVLALLHGNIKQSFVLYPPTIPILLLLVFYITTRFAPQHSRFLKPMLILAGLLILINYGFKVWGLLNHTV